MTVDLPGPVRLLWARGGRRGLRHVLATPGRYEVEEVENPLLPVGDPWLVLAGQRRRGRTIGMTAEGLRRAIERARKRAEGRLNEEEEAE